MTPTALRERRAPSPRGERFRRSGDGAARAARGRPRGSLRARAGPGPAHRRPGARAPAARPASGRSPSWPAHRHLRLRLSGLAARRPRQGARAQPRPLRRASRPPHARPQRGARRDLRLGQPDGDAAARRPLRRRAGALVRQGARRRPRRRRAASRQLRRRPAQRRRARRGRRRPGLEVLDAAERLRDAAGQLQHAGLLPRRRAGRARPRPARLRLLARLGPLERPQGRHQRRRRSQHRRRRPRPRELRCCPSSATSTSRTRSCCRRTRSSSSGRCSVRAPSWRSSTPASTTSTASRARATPGWASSAPARATSTCATRCATSASTSVRSSAPGCGCSSSA